MHTPLGMCRIPEARIERPGPPVLARELQVGLHPGSDRPPIESRHAFGDLLVGAFVLLAAAFLPRSAIAAGMMSPDLGLLSRLRNCGVSRVERCGSPVYPR